MNSNKINKFNNYLGDKLAFWLSTMAAFYIVTAFVLIPLLFQTPHDLVGWIQYIIQSLFQGSALPILAYVSKLEGAKTEKVLLETHDTVMNEFDKINNLIGLLQDEVVMQKDETTELHTILSDLAEINSKLVNK